MLAYTRVFLIDQLTNIYNDKLWMSLNCNLISMICHGKKTYLNIINAIMHKSDSYTNVDSLRVIILWLKLKSRFVAVGETTS